MGDKIILGVSGEAGSFSEEAALLYARQADIAVNLDFLVDMDGVLAAVSRGQVSLGIFPVVNTRGGLVSMAFEAMGKYLFTWIDQMTLNVKQCLMVRRGVPLQQIEKIVSHPQGLAQCELFLQKNLPNAERAPWQDTAMAARDLAEGKLDAHSAVIASARAADMYGLEILAENIQDIQPNLTTFIIVKR